MKKKSRAGRISKDKEPLFIERILLIKDLKRKGYEQVDIAWIFSLHPAQINRMLNNKKHK